MVELVFESRLSYQVLRQDAGVESEPIISLQLELSDAPKIYVADDDSIDGAAWTMQIHRRRKGAASPAPGEISFAGALPQARCAIDVWQSAERYAALLDMFKGGHVSEITVSVDGLVERADYSKAWDTASGARLSIRSICFEFPLPQSEA